jgi:hypothetical protein
MHRMIGALLCLPLLSAQHAEAAGVLTPNGTGTRVLKYQAHGQGGLTVWVVGISNPDGCGSTTVVHIPYSLEGYNVLVSSVMSAHMLDKKIGIQGSGCTLIPALNSQSTYPVVSETWTVD